jgi:hypothetical protein
MKPAPLLQATTGESSTNGRSSKTRISRLDSRGARRTYGTFSGNRVSRAQRAQGP